MFARVFNTILYTVDNSFEHYLSKITADMNIEVMLQLILEKIYYKYNNEIDKY